MTARTVRIVELMAAMQRLDTLIIEESETLRQTGRRRVVTSEDTYALDNWLETRARSRTQLRAELDAMSLKDAGELRWHTTATITEQLRWLGIACKALG